MFKAKKLYALVASVVVASSMFAVPAMATSKAAEGSSNTSMAKEEVKVKDVEINKEVEGSIDINGSSTVYPLTEAIIEKAAAEMPNLEITAAGEGSGTGLKMLINGDIDVAGASRKIKDEELATAKENGIEIVEIQVAIDGIAVVVNKDNKVDEITTAELNKIWAADSTVKTWKEVNDAWEDTELKLYAPGAASGTFEYFTEHVNKKAKEGRSEDVQTSEDDNVLVTGVAGDKGAMGYFGFTYYEENMDKVKALKIDGVEATKENIIEGKYPLSRPLFLYVNKAALKDKEEVNNFIKFYLVNAIESAEEIKMVPATAEMINKDIDELEK